MQHLLIIMVRNYYLMMIDIETAGHVVFVRQKHHGENFMTLFVLFGTDDQELD